MTPRKNQRHQSAVAAMRLATEAFTLAACATDDDELDVLLGEQALALLRRAETLRLLAK